MWEISNIGQGATFVWALLLGIVFSFLYDILKSLRLSFRHGALAVALEDFSFCALCALLAFSLFMFTTNGQPRGYAYFAMGAGFMLWRITVSKYQIKILKRIFRIVFVIRSKIKSIFQHFYDKISLKTEKVFKKLLSKLKKVLKGVKRLVYNLFNRKRDKKSV